MGRALGAALCVFIAGYFRMDFGAAGVVLAAAMVMTFWIICELEAIRRKK